jgi:hypothetical protein
VATGMAITIPACWSNHSTHPHQEVRSLIARNSDTSHPAGGSVTSRVATTSAMTDSAMRTDSRRHRRTQVVSVGAGSVIGVRVAWLGRLNGSPVESRRVRLSTP